MFPRTRLEGSRRFHILAICLCSVGAALVNYYYALDLAFGINLVLGNSLAILALLLTPHPLAGLAPLFGMSASILLWQHPWALASYLLEGIFLYLVLRQRKAGHILWLETLYWPLLGIPLIILQYYFFLNMSFNGALAAGVKQGANAILNVVLAVAIFYSLSFIGRPSRLAPRAKTYILLFINMLLILPFFMATLIFVRHGKTSMLLAAKNETAFVLETLGKGLLDYRDASASARLTQLSGYELGVLGSDGSLQWSTEPYRADRLVLHERILYQEGRVSIRTTRTERNPMKAWQQAYIYGSYSLDTETHLVLTTSFAPVVSRMNNQITFTFIFLLLWLAAGSSIVQLFAGFLTKPLERLRRNAELLQAHPGQDLSWPDFPIMEFKELRDSLVAMTGALNNRSLELAEAQQAAVQMLQQTEQYVQFMGHELKAPLAAVHNAIDLLREDTENSKQIQDMIQESTANLLQLINDILDQARAKQRQLRFSPEFFSPLKELRACLEPFAIQAQRKGLAFRMQLDPLLSTQVWSDRLRFRQLFSNLISNAIKYTPSGHIAVTVNAKALPGHRISLNAEIEDSGCGIAVEDQELIWEAFAAAKGRLSGQQTSHGLGLSIVKAIIDTLGGTIRVDSRKGAGCRFSFSIILDTPASAEQGRRSGQDGEVSTLGLQGLDCLVVDDDAISRMMLEQLLSSQGAAVQLAESGSEALVLAKTQRFPVIILDHYLPGLSGLELAMAIREHEAEARQAPAILIGCSGSHTLMDGPPFDAVMPKPVDSQRLISLLIHLLPEHRA